MVYMLPNVSRKTNALAVFFWSPCGNVWNGVIDLGDRSDEIPKSMVLSTLNPSRGCQDSIIEIPARESNREDANSRKKIQNILTDSAAGPVRSMTTVSFS